MNENFSRMVSDYLIEQQTKEERATLAQRVIAVLGVVCLIVLVGIATNAAAAPIYRAEAEGVVITLYDEDCKLPEVSNLKKRATWKEKGKTYEGCAGQHPAYPIVMAYFSDKTVVVLPIDIFAPVTGA